MYAIRSYYESRRGVDRIAGDRKLACARIAAPHDHQSGARTGVHAECAADARRELVADGAHRSVQFDRGAYRAALV